MFPEDFGLLNGSGHCVMPGIPPFACKNPDDYLFWDGTHPTKAAHGVIAKEVAAKLAE